MVGTARKLAAAFFTSFAQSLGAPDVEVAATEDEDEA